MKEPQVAVLVAGTLALIAQLKERNDPTNGENYQKRAN